MAHDLKHYPLMAELLRVVEEGDLLVIAKGGKAICDAQCAEFLLQVH